jgi:hypothetical protein
MPDVPACRQDPLHRVVHDLCEVPEVRLTDKKQDREPPEVAHQLEQRARRNQGRL